MEQDLICLEGISYIQDKRTILDSIHLNLKSGTFTTLIGPNGAGKTTLVKIILGLLSPTQGTLKKDSNLKIGYVPQKFYLDPTFPLRVKDFFKLSPSDLSSPEKSILFELTEISPFLLNQLMFHLSGGELQRVLLTYVLLGRPNLLILDEPLQGLDIDAERMILKLLQSLKENEKISILMVSHDLHMVFQHSDYVICLQKHICCEGVPSSVRVSDAYYKLFPQSRLEPLTAYTHQHDHTHTGECSHD
jgi:zinc transport system ATP-binding protein